MWIFGYGSLIWKVDFPYEEKIVGFIKGYDRRFYQLSTDHRGTPENPGRVVTLIPSQSKESKVYGIAYKIREEDQEHVISHLDHREKGGYTRVHIPFFPKNAENEIIKIVLYIANHDNPQYAGPAHIDSIAEQVVMCVGPSGTNIEYVKNLAVSMRDIAPDVDDEHLFTLEKKIKSLLMKSIH